MGDVDPKRLHANPNWPVQQLTPQPTSMVNGFTELTRIVNSLLRSNPLENAHIPEGGVTVEGTATIRSTSFDGDLTVGRVGTQGWALGADRLALLGALVVPVDFYNDFASGNNYGITSAPTVKTSITVPVPRWAAEAGAIAISMISAQNNSASSDSLNGRSRIDGIEGQLFNATVTTGEVFDVTLGQTEVRDVRDRDSFDVDIQVWTGGNTWPADNANNAALTLLVVFRGEG
ncbi:hypothetical protein [Haloechinothrix salitolerans]|uniref:Uncharacterized protein n=1 Tax=Haloechinothrix salitolerans TaxID=926830 RepID=A0ABW2C4T3_9PSEU